MSRSRLASLVLLGLVLSGCATAPLALSPEPTPEALSPLEAYEPGPPALVEYPEPIRFRLPNGLKVVLLPRHELPMVTCSLRTLAGGIYDPAGGEGLAYITAWALTEGTASFGKEEIDRLAEDRGAWISSVAHTESAEVGLTCLAEDLEDLFPVFAEVFRAPSLEESQIRLALAQTMAGLQRDQDDPEQRCREQFRRSLFTGHPYHRRNEGTLESLAELTREDCLRFHRDHYVPERSCLVVAGDVSATQVRRLSREHLGGASWESGPDLPEIPMASPLPAGKVILVDRPGSQAQIVLGHLGVQRGHPDQYSLRVMGTLLGGGGLWTRLARSVRVERGLTYGIYSSFALRRYRGEFDVSTFTKTGSVGEVLDLVRQELRRLRVEPVGEEELEHAKASITGSFPLWLEKYESLADWLQHIEFFDLGDDYLRLYTRRIDAVTAPEVLRAAQEHLHPDRLLVVIVGDAEAIRSQVEGFGPVEVVSFAEPAGDWPPPDQPG